MILSTHAVVGGALAGLFPSHPVAAFAVGFASHFVIDAIPHWDYPLRSISVARGARNQVRLTPALARDVALIGFDAIVGLTLAIGICDAFDDRRSFSRSSWSDAARPLAVRAHALSS